MATTSVSFFVIPHPVHTKLGSVLSYHGVTGFPIDVVIAIDALEEVVDNGGLPYLQHFEGSRFGAAPSSMAASRKLVAQGNLQLNGHVVTLEQVGSLVTHVRVYGVPPSFRTSRDLPSFGSIATSTLLSMFDTETGPTSVLAPASFA